MSLFNMLSEQRPRMDVPKGKKDKKYHTLMNRADRSSINAGVIQRLHLKGLLAEKAFNDEIFTQEDIDTLLLDESNNVRNRVLFGFNMIKPFVEQLRGGAIQAEFSASVQAVSHQMITRRQMYLAQHQNMHSLAEMSPEMKRIVGANYNIGDTMSQTTSMADSGYQDRFPTAMRHLLQQMEVINEMDRFRGEDAYRFAMSGLLAEILVPNGSHLYWKKIHPREFFFDTNNTHMPDLSDSAFVGCMPQMSMSAIAEQWNVSKDDLSDIENSIHNFGLSSTYRHGGAFNLMSQTKVRVTSDYWQDVSFSEFGYVSLHGIETLVPIGYSEHGEEPKYVKNDCVPPPDTKDNKELFNGELTRKSFVEVTRFSDVVLWEDMAGRDRYNENDRKRYEEGETPDLVLDYGLYNLQEYNPFDTNRSRSPVKAVTFARADGEIVSPVQALLDPNRYVSRIMSAIEGQMNMSGGKTPMVDMDLVDEKYSVEMVQSRIKQNKLIPFRAGGRGIGNAIGSHDDSPGTGTYAMLQIVSSVQDLVRTVTGVHQPMMGGADKDLGKGVAELLIQRGSIMQEPFYDCLADLQLQKYRCMVTAGKEWYVQRPDVLVDMVSDEDMLALLQSEDFEIERFNCKVIRDNPDRLRKKQANDWLNQLVQLGLIDAKMYFDMFDKSHVEDIGPAVRRYTAELQMAENEQRKEDAKQQMLAGLTAQSQQLDEQERAVNDKQMDNAATLAKEGLKATANFDRENIKAEHDKDRMAQEATQVL